MTNIEQMIQDLCPNGVEWKTFDELGVFYGGLSGKNKDDFKEGNAKFITYLNIANNPALRLDIEETVKIGSNEKQNIVQYGDALFTGSSETPDECAMSSVVTDHPSEKLYLNSFCFGFRFNSLDGICPAFYKHYFRSGAFRKAVRRTANGTTRFNVSKKEFAKLEIPLPPLEIQQRIVEVLDRFSALAAELQAELQKRRTQYEYYRTRLLTPPPTENISSDNSTDESKWEWKTLGEVCDSFMGEFVKKDKQNPNGKFPVFNGGSAPTGFYDDFNTDANKVIISARGAGAGFVNRVYTPFWAGNSCHVLKIKDSSKIYWVYLYYYLKNMEQSLISHQQKGGGVPAISKKQVEEIQIALPPLAEQIRIADLLDKFEALTTSLSEGIPAEQAAQQKRYEYYRDLLLTFDRKNV